MSIYGVQGKLIVSTFFKVYKTGITHYFSIEKARRELGYTPTIQNDMSRVVQHYINTGHKKHTTKRETFLYWIVNVLIGAVFAVVLMSYLPIIK